MRNWLSSVAVLLVLVASGCRTRPDLSDDLSTRQGEPGANEAMAAEIDRAPAVMEWQSVNNSRNTGLPNAVVDGAQKAKPPSETSQWTVPPEVKPKDPAGAWGKTNQPLSTGAEDYKVEKTWEPVYFEYDKSLLSATEQTKLVPLAAYLVANPAYHLLIEGHCDDRGGDEYNRTLGERRALAAKDFLVANKVAAARIRTMSLGEERPAVKGSDEASRAKNRRDELLIITLNKP